MRKIITPLIVSLLISCSTSKHNVNTALVSQDTVTAVTEQVDKAVHTQDNSRVDTSETSDKVTEEYDTDKPVDPATGTPPIKRRITETAGKKTAALSNALTDSRELSATQVAASAKATTAVKIEEQKKSIPNYLVILLLSVVCGLSGVAIIVYNKLKNNYYGKK